MTRKRAKKKNPWDSDSSDAEDEDDSKSAEWWGCQSVLFA